MDALPFTKRQLNNDTASFLENRRRARRIGGVLDNNGTTETAGASSAAAPPPGGEGMAQLGTRRLDMGQCANYTSHLTRAAQDGDAARLHRILESLRGEYDAWGSLDDIVKSGLFNKVKWLTRYGEEDGRLGDPTLGERMYSSLARTPQYWEKMGFAKVCQAATALYHHWQVHATLSQQFATRAEEVAAERQGAVLPPNFVSDGEHFKTDALGLVFEQLPGVHDIARLKGVCHSFRDVAAAMLAPQAEAAAVEQAKREATQKRNWELNARRNARKKEQKKEAREWEKRERKREAEERSKHEHLVDGLKDQIKARATELFDAKPSDALPKMKDPRTIAKDVVARQVLTNEGHLQDARDKYPECREIIGRLLAALQLHSDKLKQGPARRLTYRELQSECMARGLPAAGGTAQALTQLLAEAGAPLWVAAAAQN